MSAIKFTHPLLPGIDAELLDVLARFPALVQSLVFGSVAQGRQRTDSDLVIAAAATCLSRPISCPTESECWQKVGRLGSGSS